METWPATCYKLNEGKATYANGQPVQPRARLQDMQTAALAKFLWQSRRVKRPEHQMFKDRAGASEVSPLPEANGPAALTSFNLDQGLCCM